MDPPGRGGAKQQGGVLSSGRCAKGDFRGAKGDFRGAKRTNWVVASVGAPPPETEKSV